MTSTTGKAVPPTPQSRPPLERMLRIHQAIQSGKFPNASTLARELEVSAKSVHRDLEFMRDRLELPLEYDGKLLRFFHSTLDNEFAFPNRMVGYRRYFLGACLMDPTPPFQTVAVSRKPIVYGSEICGAPVPPGVVNLNSRVVFPGGAIARDGYWVVAVGVNDYHCALLKITPKELNL